MKRNFLLCLLLLQFESPIIASPGLKFANPVSLSYSCSFQFLQTLSEAFSGIAVGSYLSLR